MTLNFRAWDCEAKEMREVVVLNFYDETYSWVLDDYENGVQEWLDEKLSDSDIMQYTGHIDKYDNEIYEKDLVSDEYGRIYQVVFKGDCWRCETVKGGAKNRWISNDLEVAGNIYENPELLEVQG